VSAREERVVSAAVVVCVDRQCGGVVWRGRLWRESVRDEQRGVCVEAGW
jgi:hypothetical protein